MWRAIQTALAALGICSGCSKSNILGPTAFTSEFATALSKSSPELKIEIVRDLQLKVTAADGTETTSFLDNSYDNYKLDPRSKDEIIERFIAAGLETIEHLQKPQELDRTRIIAVVKDRPWIEDSRKAIASRGAKTMPENVYEDLNSDLIILYAEDSPKTIRYLAPKDLEEAQISRSELRKLACENLKRLLPKIERHGTNGLYMLTAGGDYEASLLLLDSVWSDLQKEVRGDIVVALPTRDLLYVTGSENTKGIEKMRQLTEKMFAEGSYRLTPKLFLFNSGRLDEFKQ